MYIVGLYRIIVVDENSLTSPLRNVILVIIVVSED